MMITRKSVMTGVERSLDIPISAEDLKKWEEGLCLIQEIQGLSPSQREFIMSGIVDEEWDDLFGEEDE